MKLSEKSLTWVLRLFPPFLFQRIYVQKFHQDFRGVEVKIFRSFLNRNSNGSIFGGTIFAATDPVYALLFGQLMRRRGIRPLVWLKSANIRYLKPAWSHLYITVRIDDSLVEEIEQTLREQGKFVKTLHIEILDKNGEICAVADNEVYIRNRDFKPVS